MGEEIPKYFVIRDARVLDRDGAISSGKIVDAEGPYTFDRAMEIIQSDPRSYIHLARIVDIKSGQLPGDTIQQLLMEHGE